MAEKVHTGAGVDWRFVELASNPARFSAFELLAARTMSPRGIATELGMSMDAAREHIKGLQKMDLVELADRRAEGGEVVPFYRAVSMPMWSTEELGELSLEERLGIATWLMELIRGDAAAALKAGTFNARSDTHVSRTRVVVDEQGWRELNRIQDDALDASFEVQAASAERLARGGEEGVHVMAAMLCVEMPEPNPPA